MKPQRSRLRNDWDQWRLIFFWDIGPLTRFLSGACNHCDRATACLSYSSDQSLSGSHHADAPTPRTLVPVRTKKKNTQAKIVSGLRSLGSQQLGDCKLTQQ